MAHPQFSFLQSLWFEKLQFYPCAELSEDEKKRSLFSVILTETMNSAFRGETNLVETRNIVTVQRKAI